MSELRLLKRMANWQQVKRGDSNISPIPQLLHDVEQLLNCQQGNILIDPKMGLTDLQSQFQSHGSPDTEALTTQLSSQIKEFEPRISDLVLEFDENNRDVTCFSWKLSATAFPKSSSIAFMAIVKVKASGHVVLEEAQ